MSDEIETSESQNLVHHSTIPDQSLNNNVSSNETVKTKNNINTDASNEISSSPTTIDSATLGSTISHIVGALSPSNATTSPTKTTVVIDSARNADAITTPSSTITNNENSYSTNSNASINSKSASNLNSTIDSIHLAPPITSIQSHPGVKFVQSDQLEASFTGVSNKNTDPISMVLPDSNSDQNDEKSSNQQTSIMGGIGVALGMLNSTTEKNDSELESSSTNNKNNNNKNSIVKSSPLLSSTPPTVSKSLIKSYPFLILVLKILNILTWNDNSNHLPVLLVLITIFAVLYYEPLIIYLGHLLPVLAIWIYSESKNYVKTYQSQHSTLDDIIQTMSLISNRSEILISPIVELGLTAGDLKRLLFTTVFLSPVYVVISFFFLPPNKMILSLLVLILTYHSKWSKITRALLWKSRSFRLLCFYLTGLDFENSGLSKASSLFSLNKRLSKRFGKTNTNSDSFVNNSSLNSNSKSSSVRFTYVIYENQRRWLGVGWTPNLLSYERTPWTDDFLNESEPIDSFELPQLPLSIDLQDSDSTDLNINSNSNDNEILNTKGMVWRWIDKTWRLDLTNDGSIQLSSTKPRTTANPRPDDGWIYYDNTWKNPTTEDGFSKYTRRRRWIRTAELVYITKDGKDIPVKNNSINNKNVKIQEGTASLPDNEKGVRFDNLDSPSTYPSSNDGPTSGQSLKEKPSKGGLKRSDSGEIKKRKSLRFEESPADL